MNVAVPAPPAYAQVGARLARFAFFDRGVWGFLPQR